jgi:hypothetical protein
MILLGDKNLHIEFSLKLDLKEKSMIDSSQIFLRQLEHSLINISIIGTQLVVLFLSVLNHILVLQTNLDLIILEEVILFRAQSINPQLDFTAFISVLEAWAHFPNPMLSKVNVRRATL